MEDFFHKEPNKNTPTYLLSNICIALCSVNIVLFVVFLIPSVILTFDTDLGLLLASYLVYLYIIGAFILPLTATIFGICSIKYNIKHCADFKNNSKTNKKNKTCIVLLLFVIPTAVFYCVSGLKM